MEFGPHSSFIPHSPLSYSNSYVPQSSPIPKNNDKRKDAGLCFTLTDEKQQRTLQNPSKNSSVRKNSRSILKNCSDGRGESQERKQQKYGSNYSLASLSEKKSTKQPVQRKETLKTVAFGLTTKLDETVLGKEGKTPSTSRDSSRTKTIIFSHEAQSLHKLILEQKHQIDTLRDTVEDLKTEQENQRVGDREQLEIISALAKRLQEIEKQKNVAKNASNESTANIFKSNSEKKELPAKSLPKVDKATSVEDFSKNREDNKKKELSGGGIVLPRRNDFLQQLEYEMVKNPVFEQRLHSMLRVWSEDSTVPPVIFNKNNKNIPVEDEGSCGPSVVMRVTTQRQEIFYSSPGRSSNNVRRFPRSEDVRGGGQRRNFQREKDENNEDSRPRIKVIELDDDGEEKENDHEETDDHYHHHEDQQTINTMLKNVHRSEQLGTDEAAEFFLPQRQDYEEDNDKDDEEEFFGGGNGDQQRRGRKQHAHPHHHQPFDDCNDENINNNQHNRYPFNRRRKREANSTIRNRYR